MHGLSGDDTGGLELDSLTLVRDDLSVAVNGVTEGVDDTTEEGSADGDVDNSTSPLDNISFLDLSINIKRQRLDSGKD